MGDEGRFDLDALLGIPAREPEAPTAFEESVGVALAAAVATMRRDGMLDVEDADVEALVRELREAAAESSSLKRLLKRVVNVLVHSDRVQEVYGTDEALSAMIRRSFEAT